MPLQPAGAAADGHPMPAALFTATSLLSAFLLFLVQPLVAKLVLPPYGGSSSVWNTTNAFFQATLLAGYAYSHVLSSRVRPRRQAPIHVLALLLPLAALPLALPSWAAPPEDRPPAAWLVLVLLVAVGAPFLAVATTGPLLQRWFSFTDHPRADDPYFLYAAGNVGSFLALLAYPTVLEVHWPVADLARAWAVGYVVLVGLVGTCGLVARRSPGAAPAPDRAAPEPATTTAPSRSDRLRWLVLAAAPSTLLLGVTSYITADMAAVPLLWVLPLAAYLATFVVAFGRPGSEEPRIAAAVLVAALVVVGALVVGDLDVPLPLAIGAHLVLFTAGAQVAHRRLALRRPDPDHLTGFYLVVALGGVLGGAWNAFVAPLVFDRVVEYPLAILAVAVLGLAPLGAGRPPLRHRYGRPGLGLEVALGFAATFAVASALEGEATALALVGLAALAAAAVAGRRAAPALAVGAAALLLVQVLAPLPNDPVLESRTFFGVYRIDRFDGHLELVSGSTSHGAQDPSRPGEPLSYYSRGGPVGQLMEVFAPDADEIGLVGLGVGAIAAYGRPGQRFTFHEIDPEVVRIARDTGWFTYLTDTPAAVEYRIGDGRLGLAAEARSYDVLVLDAFSGDAVPVHLLTAEAFALYADRLAPGGVIAVHISNRYLDLRPVVAGAAAASGMSVRVRRDASGAGAGTSGSWWAVVAPDAGTLAPLDGDERWHRGDEAGVVRWTDQRSNLLDVLGTAD